VAYILVIHCRSWNYSINKADEYANLEIEVEDFYTKDNIKDVSLNKNIKINTLIN